MKQFLIPALLSAAVFTVGCSEDDSGPTSPADGGDDGYTVTLDATASGAYAYYNLITRTTVALTDEAAKSSNVWHIAWSRVYGKLNGGVAGPLGIKAVNLAAVGSPNATDFSAVNAVPDVPDSLWVSDTYHFAFSPWYAYNPATHQLFPTRNVFIVRTVDGKYAKVMIDSLKNPGMPPNMGVIGLKYVYNSSGGTDLSGAAQYVEIDGASGDVFFSFAQGGAVVVNNPAASSDWDLRFKAYDAMVNGGISGPGNAAVYPMHLENNDFEAVTAAPQGGGYFTDAIRSVFGDPTVPGSEWYDYNPQTHEIVSRGNVYILKLPGDVHFKLQITNYYKLVDGTPQSGWVTLKFKQL